MTLMLFNLEMWKRDTYEVRTSSPMGNDHSPESQHNVWKHHILGCTKAGNYELETAIRP